MAFHVKQAFYMSLNHKLLAHLSRRLVGELVVYPWSFVRRPSGVHNFKHEYLCNQWANHNEIISEHHWDGRKAALGFGPDRIKTLVSMATDNSHRVIMEKTVLPFFLSCFSSDPFNTCR